MRQINARTKSVIDPVVKHEVHWSSGSPNVVPPCFATASRPDFIVALASANAVKTRRMSRNYASILWPYNGSPPECPTKLKTQPFNRSARKPFSPSLFAAPYSQRAPLCSEHEQSYSSSSTHLITRLLYVAPVVNVNKKPQPIQDRLGLRLIHQETKDLHRDQSVRILETRLLEVRH
jgi:hypothetical protein